MPVLLSFAQWIQATDFFTALRGSAYVYPIVLTLHMCGIALFGGMVLMTDLRLLGVSMKKYPIADVVDQFRGLKHLGLLLIVVCGLLMAGAKAEEYYYNLAFWIKMSILSLIIVHAIVFRGSVYRRAAEFDKAPEIPGQAKLAATLSLILWSGMVIAGRTIGYIEAPIEKLHAMLIHIH
jgi:hypothetical protein